MGILKGINIMFSIQGVGRTGLYIGGEIEVYKDDTGKFHYVTSARKYIKNVCDNIETLFETNIRNYRSNLLEQYRSEMKTSKLLVGDDIYKYRSIIGCLNWDVTLGKFDVNY